MEKERQGPAGTPPETGLESSTLIKRDQPFRWAWALSALLHVGTFGGFFAVSLWDGCQGPPPEEKLVVAKLVRLGTPRDERHLPRLPASPAVPPATKDAPQVTPGRELPPRPEPKPEPTPPPPAPEPAPAPPKAEQPKAPEPTPKPPPQQATAPKQAETSPNRLDDIMERFAAAERRGPAEPLPGQLDGDPEGTAEEAAEGERYLALLQKRLRDNYVLPSTIPEAERIRLSAEVRIHIEKNGRMSDFSIVRSSGNPRYDGALEAAVNRSSPFPPPPDHLLRAFPNGFRVRFSL